MARCPERLQEAFSILVSLFKCVSLSTNAQKTKVMTSIPGKIRVSQPEEVCNDYCQGASTHAARKQLRVECDICNQSMQVASLCSHLESQHDVFQSFVLNRDLEREPSMSICMTVQYQTALVGPALCSLSDGISFSGTPSTWWSSCRRGYTPTPDALGVTCKRLQRLSIEAISRPCYARECIR